MIVILLAIIVVILFFTMMILRRISINFTNWANSNIAQMGRLVVKD